jgi:hypothetical protein
MRYVSGMKGMNASRATKNSYIAYEIPRNYFYIHHTCADLQVNSRLEKLFR